MFLHRRYRRVRGGGAERGNRRGAIRIRGPDRRRAAKPWRKLGVSDEGQSEIRADGSEVAVLLHSLAFGTLRPLVGSAEVASRRQLEMTSDVMGHSLIYWTHDLLSAGLMKSGGRIYAMTSEGGGKAIPQYGAVCAAKAILEAHIRQLALELAPHGITANAIMAGVTDTPALRKIPGNEKLMEYAKARNPHHRLTTPIDVARCIAGLCNPGTYWMTGNTLRVDGGEGSVG